MRGSTPGRRMRRYVEGAAAACHRGTRYLQELTVHTRPSGAYPLRMQRSETVVEDLEHDHGDLNREVLALAAHVALVQGDEISLETSEVADHLVALRDHLFLHFVREEEGLFPFLASAAPDLEDRVSDLIVMHDEICGSLARMVQIVETSVSLQALVPLFQRFQASYVRHASAERALLEEVATRLTGVQRAELAACIRGV
jgi:iron-sulfur cluster repair protein YtfE (RIC family)